MPVRKVCNFVERPDGSWADARRGVLSAPALGRVLGLEGRVLYLTTVEGVGVGWLPGNLPPKEQRARLRRAIAHERQQRNAK